MPFASKISQTTIQYILGHTLYETMRTSPDFEDVKSALNDRTDWSIELFRSCFANGGYFFMLSTLSFLILAESIRMYCGRLSAAKLKEHAETMGYAPFAILFAVLDIGSVVVRVSGLVALSGSPRIATGLALVSMSPSVLLPLFYYTAKLVRRREREPNEREVESGVVAER